MKQLPEYKKQQYIIDSWLINIDNIYDKKQADAILFFIKKYIGFSRWIWHKEFVSVLDVYSELVLLFAEQKIINYDTDFVIKKICSLIYKMWVDYYKSKPILFQKVSRHQKKYSLEYKKDTRKNMGNWYVKHLFGKTHKAQEVTVEMIEQKREHIIRFRNGLEGKICGSGITFTKQEDDILKFGYSTKTQRQLSVDLGRSIKSIEKRLARLGIKKQK